MSQQLAGWQSDWPTNKWPSIAAADGNRKRRGKNVEGKPAWNLSIAAGKVMSHANGDVQRKKDENGANSNREKCVCVRSVGNICPIQSGRHIIGQNLNYPKTESRSSECCLSGRQPEWRHTLKWPRESRVLGNWHYRTHYRLTGASGASNWLEHIHIQQRKWASSMWALCNSMQTFQKISLAGHFLMSDQLSYPYILRHS